jgi:hypothetical protein
MNYLAAERNRELLVNTNKKPLMHTKSEITEKINELQIRVDKLTMEIGQLYTDYLYKDEDFEIKKCLDEKVKLHLSLKIRLGILKMDIEKANGTLFKYD